MGSKTTVRYLHKYTPAKGIKEDFEDLLQRFIATETVRYENFVEIWRDMKMPLMFAGRQTEREVREFIEECFRIASQYVLAPYNFQVRVGALYLLYGLFNIQPLFHRVKIRTTNTMWLDLLEFQSEAQRQQHLDVDFVFHKLRFQNAFLFTAKQIEVLHTVDKNKDEVSLSEEFKEEQSVLFDLFSTEMLEQMATVHQHYEAIKVALEGPQATHPSRSLSVIKQDLVPGITKAIIYYQDRRKAGAFKKKAAANVGDDLSSDSMDNEDEEDVDMKPSKKLLLKEKAFAKATVPSGHFRRGKFSASSGSERDEPKHPETVPDVPVPDVPVTVKEMSDEDPDDKDSEQVTALKKSLLNMPFIPTGNDNAPRRGRRKKGKGMTRKKSKSARLVVNPLPAYSGKVNDGGSPVKRGRSRPKRT
ncbi:snRNA-activating protein complex subunit 1-like [Mizuhopecten yessoensis]|uniref:snRNA-activating protein complex subunit 1 n=1 Tax=Mizuhopecten yessoensis TaxID=6573 RepID=A0A210PVI2_MIZYE|nr:snRNA-activating protein complex subunit 1-like [Mizuhopecten yessoensis]OWF40500.1 snRNA-activating protein complex subunit 1 [Mizuhopecten yessoensis]